MNNGITVTAETVIAAGAVLAAVTAIFGVIFAVYRWYLKQGRQDEEIANIKEENTLICFALSACLDGLIQLGTNGMTHEAKDKLDKHLNKNAHK